MPVERESETIDVLPCQDRDTARSDRRRADRKRTDAARSIERRR